VPMGKGKVRACLLIFSTILQAKEQAGRGRVGFRARQQQLIEHKHLIDSKHSNNSGGALREQGSPFFFTPGPGRLGGLPDSTPAGRGFRQIQVTPFAADEFRAGFVDISVLPTSARFGRGRLSRGGLKVKSHRACKCFWAALSPRFSRALGTLQGQLGCLMMVLKQCFKEGGPKLEHL